jgi:GNAT superfamily N-acetyltransferase
MPRGRGADPSLRIRAAGAADAAALAALLGQLGYPTDAAELPAQLAAVAGAEGTVLCAVDGPSEAVLGLVALHAYPVIHAAAPTAYITALVVDAAARGRGVGRAMVAAAEEWARARGCRRLTVTSAERRADAHAFYPAAGLPYTGRRFSRLLEP